ncbi:MAG: GntR family transcriptional regulator [Lachnospirales bacterium]
MYQLEITPRDVNETARQYAFRILRHNILYLKLAPGQLISEVEISKQLNMSRTPIREALKDLEKSNIVNIEPQRGTFVSKINKQLVSNACFIRLTIEHAIIALACEGISKDYINLLEENLFMGSYYVSKGEIGKWFLQDDEFHNLIFKACGKEQVYQLFGDVMIHFNRVRIMNLKEVNMTIAHNEHIVLLDAIKARDEKLALATLDKHLTYCVEHCNVGDDIDDYNNL